MQLLLAISLFILCQGVAISNGMYDGKALTYTLVSFFLLAAFLFVKRRERLEEWSQKFIFPLLFLFVFRQLYQLANREPVFDTTGELTLHMPLYKNIMFAGLGVFAVGFTLLRNHWKIIFGLLLLCYVGGGIWVLQHSPAPQIDVFEFHKNAFAQLRNFTPPYGTTIANIYGHSNFYGEGILRDGLVQVGYPYPPLSLLLGFLADTLFGDFRALHLISNVGTAILLSRLAHGPMGALIALLFLFNPKTYFVLDQGWTEPLPVFFFAATAYACVRGAQSKTASALLGFFFAAKQYCVLFLPLYVRRDARQLGWKQLLWLALPAGLVSLPLALWNIEGFIRDVVLFQIQQPFREDSLSLLAALARVSGAQPSSGITGVALLLAFAAVIYKKQPSWAHVSSAFAFVMFVFFLFAKQAFCNYYFFVAGLLAVSLALAQSDSGEKSTRPNGPTDLQ